MLVPDITFAIMFCTLFVGGAAMALRTGRLLDTTTESTRAAAASAAAQRARAVERERFDALIHDGVIATLLTASRPVHRHNVRALASTTLRELDELHTVSDPDQSIGLDETLAQLRTATVDIDPNASFVVTGTETAETLRIPVSIVRSMSGALSEALRNSHLHAGPRATRTVTAALQADSIAITIADDGVGFDHASIPPTPPGHRRQHPRTNATHRRWISAGGLAARTRHHRAHRMDGAMTDDRTASSANHHTSDTRDVRELLGLRTTAAAVVVGAFIATFLLLALTTAPPTAKSLWAETSAWIVVSAAAVTLIRTAGDPLPYRTTLALMLAGPISLNLVFAVVPIPIDGLLQLWPLSAATAIYTYMCVRGRTWWAWLGMTATLASCAWWAQRTGQSAGYGIGISAINLAPLLMATFFAWTIRPAARDIFALREQTIIRVAAEAADTAILDERDQQLRRLDNLARPLLQHLATDEDITDEQQLACTLLEAHLRDTLRAPPFSTPPPSPPQPGQHVHGESTSSCSTTTAWTRPQTPVREQIITAVLTALTEATDGTLTVRVSPPHNAIPC